MLSVCVPFWERQPALDTMVEQYGRLYPDLDLELVIADDGSPEPAFVGLPAVHQTTVVVMPAKSIPLNPCVALNAAVNASHGDLVVITNPEIEHRTRILDAMLALHVHVDDYVQARCWDVPRRMWLAGPDTNYAGGGRGPVPPGGHFHFLTLLSRALWQRVGGFDEDYRQYAGWDDNDFLWRLHRVGATFKTTGVDDVAYHHIPGSKTRWSHLTSGGVLFRRKWPEAYRNVVA